MVVMNEFRKAPESDRSEEPKFSGSGRLQINADFLLRDDHFGALLTAGKPEADLATFWTLPEQTRSRWCPNQAVGSETIAIPCSNEHKFTKPLFLQVDSNVSSKKRCIS